MFSVGESGRPVIVPFMVLCTFRCAIQPHKYHKSCTFNGDEIPIIMRGCGGFQRVCVWELGEFLTNRWRAVWWLSKVEVSVEVWWFWKLHLLCCKGVNFRFLFFFLFANLVEYSAWVVLSRFPTSTHLIFFGSTRDLFLFFDPIFFHATASLLLSFLFFFNLSAQYTGELVRGTCDPLLPPPCAVSEVRR